jgi:phenylpropionate dioxygenase-like ring-hydroxylating dioxygenase large terminal subunit
MKILCGSWYMFGWLADVAGQERLTRIVADIPVEVMPADGGFSARVAGGRALAAAVRHRIVWIWLGDPAEADLARIPDFSCFDEAPDSAFMRGELPTKAHYELLSDNILDLSHADYLHPDTFGGMMTQTEPVVRRDGDSIFVTWESLNGPALPILAFLLPQPDQPVDLRITVRWDPAATMMLTVDMAPAGEPYENWFISHGAHIMTPESADSTHYFYGSVRNYYADDAEFTARQAEAVAYAFGHEDKPVIEAQQREMGGADFWDLKPALLSIDKGGVLARRVLAQLIRHEEPQLEHHV